MTKRDVLTAALQVLGFICLVYGVLTIASIANSFSAVSGPGEIVNEGSILVAVFTQFLMTVGCGLVLIFYADSISAWLERDDVVVPPVGTNLWQRPLLTVAVHVIGLVVAAYGLAEVVGVIADRLQYTYMDVARSWTSSDWFRAGDGSMRIVVGGYLLTGARHLVSWACSRSVAADGGRLEDV